MTSAIATGPKPPLTFSNSNDEGSPVKVSIGEGMGELLGLARILDDGSWSSAQAVRKEFQSLDAARISPDCL